jgi:Zn finger protein HypA/HybF involved in hydrogenase expression
MPETTRPAFEKILERAEEIIGEDNATGICLACGEEQAGCEPDRSRVRCDACGRQTVYGAEEILLTFALGQQTQKG